MDLFILGVFGLALAGFLHFLVPLVVICKKNRYPSDRLWLIAILGSVLGFLMCAFVSEKYRYDTGIIISIACTFVNYIVLYRKCLENPKEDDKTDNSAETIETNINKQNETNKEHNNDIRICVSREGETPKRYGNYNVLGKDMMFEKAPKQEEDQQHENKG